MHADDRGEVFGVSINSVRRSVMPGIFDNRDRGYEAKWAHDEVNNFKVLVRRNRLLGHWVAGELGLSGQEADEYAEAIVKLGLTGKANDRVFQKIRADFEAIKLGKPDQSIHAKMEGLFKIAAEEVTKGLT
jgi:hypothetical protein